MPLELSDSQFQGPALPDPFVKLELEKELNRRKLLPKTTGADGKALKQEWESYRRKLRSLTSGGGSLRVRNHVIEPLMPMLGYDRIEEGGTVQTREDRESGGSLLVSEDGQSKLRIWVTPYNEDLYAPSRRGRAYRFSHLRIAQRVLLASGERLGVLTNGVQLMLLISDPARPDSTVTIPIEVEWKRSRDVADSFRLVLALACPAGIDAIPELVDKARLQQAIVTKELRKQAREAIEWFIQEIIDQPGNRDWMTAQADKAALAHELWHEGLKIVYRLLFILKLESSDNSAQAFSFASSSLWRNTFSPGIALARFVPRVLQQGEETGRLLEQGLRNLFQMFEQGLECTELNVKPLGGSFFAANATPHLSQLAWGERAVAFLLDRLLWTPKRRGSETRERVHYGSLDVEDLGRVYEALLELEPGISAEPMCRLRRQKLEVVVPVAQGECYRPQTEPGDTATESDGASDETEDTAEDSEDSETPTSSRGTQVEWIEAIPTGRFYLRVGLGRKSTSSFYTPHSFVRFLVQETLGPQVAKRSPQDNPQPMQILRLKVLDPAMGSGHFLVEACRFLGHQLYESCRLCDEKASIAESRAERGTPEEREAALNEAAQLRKRVMDLPDPDDELLNYLPSRSADGDTSVFAQQRAEAICRRLIATHCLYGVDKNPLAVELAKLALWLESHAEGMPLTFLDHRFVVGDSLAGPFWDRLSTSPAHPDQKLGDERNIFFRQLDERLRAALFDALRHIRRLEASVGATVAETQEKEAAKRSLDDALLPYRIVAAAWSGGVMLGPDECDEVAYSEFIAHVVRNHNLPSTIESQSLREMIALGLGVPAVPVSSLDLKSIFHNGGCIPSLPYDLTFPEVFYPNGVPYGHGGFNAVLGNPPWDQPEVSEPEYWAFFDLRAVAARLQRERDVVIHQLREMTGAVAGWERLTKTVEGNFRLHTCLYEYQSVSVDGRMTVGRPDVYRLFAERLVQLCGEDGIIGVVLPSAFHANEGATGLRRLYLDKTKILSCFSFENSRKIFDIHGSFKFATLVAARSDSGTSEFDAAFYLHDEEWLFSKFPKPPRLRFSREFIEISGGSHLSFLECRDLSDFALLRTMYERSATSWSEVCTSLELSMAYGIELHRNREYALPLNPPLPAPVAWLNCKADQWRRLPFLEGKCIGQFQDHWQSPVRVAPNTEVALSKRHWRESAPFYRLTFRRIAGATDERTFIVTMLPPGAITDNTLAVETTPFLRANCNSLGLMAIGNSFAFDYLLRSKVRATVNAFILAPLPVPKLALQNRLVIHGALRLICNHIGFAELWKEQLGDECREVCRTDGIWPTVVGNPERWLIRSAIDAVVADAYGLSHDHYAHILSSFSHNSYAKAPELCLASFDELQDIGLEAFTRRHDPYWDIPLNENLPQPVIDFPLPIADPTSAASSRTLFDNEEPTPRRRRRKSP